MNTLSEAYDACEEMIKEHSKTFYRAFSMLPKRERQAIYAIYGFCRKADDAIDESLQPEKALEILEQELYSFAFGKPVNDPVWIALSDVFRLFPMEMRPFYDMMTGQRMDIMKKRYQTYEELKVYSYHVASSVGFMLLPILTPKATKEMTSHAISLGIAMQITNILRDIGEDLERNRIYLPKELMEKYSYSEADLEKKIVNEAFINLWEDLAQKAERRYDEAKQYLHLYPFVARKAVGGALILYRSILDKVRKNNYNVFSKRAYVTQKEKETILKTLTS